MVSLDGQCGEVVGLVWYKYRAIHVQHDMSGHITLDLAKL